jgi:hypothetical protein
VEEADQFFGETQKKINEKIDNICQMLQVWPAGSDVGSADRFQRRPSSLPPSPPNSALTAEELATLRKQQDEGKSSFPNPPSIRFLIPQAPKSHQTPFPLQSQTK